MFYFIGSVSLIDSDNICAGLRVLPGETVILQCVVNNTGATGSNVLIWDTPVS